MDARGLVAEGVGKTDQPRDAGEDLVRDIDAGQIRRNPYHDALREIDEIHLDARVTVAQFRLLPADGDEPFALIFAELAGIEHTELDLAPSRVRRAIECEQDALHVERAFVV